MNNSTVKEKVCVYCGEKDNLTADHVPPKALFAKPRPQLITVPACKDCNENAKLDDDYFQIMLALRGDLSNNNEVKKISRKVVSSINHVKKSGFKNRLMSKVQMVQAYSKGGIYLGRQPSLEVDMNRMTKVAARCVTGLYFHHQKSRVPSNFGVSAMPLSNLKNVPPSGVIWTETLVNDVRKEKINTIRNSVFQYHYKILPEDGVSSLWLMIFYGKVEYIGLVTENNA
jgi:hypothetical protein